MFGTGNQGNEASLKAAVVQIRRVSPGSRIVVACADPATVAVEHGVAATPITPAERLLDPLPRPVRLVLRPAIEIGRWAIVFARVRRADHVVVAGTGILDDHGMRPIGMPYHLFGWALMARFARRPFSLVSVGAGPIEHPLSLRLLRAAARLASDCTFRDDLSMDFMHSIGRDTRLDRVVPDLVFSLDFPPSTADRLPRPTDARACVGVGVMMYPGWDGRDIRDLSENTYLHGLAAFILRLLERDYRVRLLVGSAEDDSAVADLFRLLDSSGAAKGVREHVEFEPHSTFGELVEQVRATDVAVVSRYHNVVGALIAGRPVVSMGYAEKNRDLLRLVGLDGYCQRIDDFDVDRLLRDTEIVLQRRGELGDVIQRVVADFRRRAAEQFDHCVVGKD